MKQKLNQDLAMWLSHVVTNIRFRLIAISACDANAHRMLDNRLPKLLVKVMRIYTGSQLAQTRIDISVSRGGLPTTSSFLSFNSCDVMRQAKKKWDEEGLSCFTAFGI